MSERQAFTAGCLVDQVAEVMRRATEAHDKTCSCDPRYRMSCARMAAAILAQGTAGDRPTCKCPAELCRCHRVVDRAQG
ncbi:hypothetical protein AB0N38_33240 [Micromonospora aurantiaca]|uniref:hypothetical protein n=1 Tax=Micromonospora aurantiaca (nom. illeg.) TaxID=47850 RepID=UPI003449CC93